MHREGPLLVIAGPGSGKTATMIERLAHMIEVSKVDPERILVITFSRASANEMESRFIKRMHTESLKVHFGTFHSIFLGMLKEYYGDKFKFNLVNENIKKSIISELLMKIGFDFVINDFIDEFLLDITLYKNSDVDISSYTPVSCDKKLFMSIYSLYEEKLLKNGFMDFDDIIILTNKLLDNKSDFRYYWQNRFDYILIDEFQDINIIQFKAIYKLACRHNNLFAVGDEDQSIYGFRGSNPNIMVNFKKLFPEAETIYLSNNYRSGFEIVNLAGNLIKNNNDRYDKEIIASNKTKAFVRLIAFNTDTEQIKYIKEIILNNNCHSIAILCRTNAMKNYYTNCFEKNIKYISILTMHEAKGLEFDTVIIPNVIEGLCPYVHSIYGSNIEEERRLFYVALTRAKTNLYISYTKTYKRKKAKKSRFINELKIKRNLGGNYLQTYHNK